MTQKIVKDLFDYNKDTGELSWIKSTPRRDRKDGEVGYLHCMGYRSVSINGKDYLVHRVIWLWNYGYFPENMIDHIDRNKLNNKLDNLRESTAQCNIRNSKLSDNNKSGVKGVSFSNRDKRWIARVTVNREVKHLGNYEDFIDAVAARLAAEQSLDWKGCDSTSPAYLFMRGYLNGQSRV